MPKVNSKRQLYSWNRSYIDVKTIRDEAKTKTDENA